MARFELDGFEEFDKAFRAVATIPWSVTKQALAQMADTAKAAVKRAGESMGVRDDGNEEGPHILDSIVFTKTKKIRGGGYADLTFEGSRKRGNTVTRNAEIAFVNEYGASRRGIAARPFVANGMASGEGAINEAADEIIGGWIENTYGSGS